MNCSIENSNKKDNLFTLSDFQKLEDINWLIPHLKLITEKTYTSI